MMMRKTLTKMMNMAKTSEYKGIKVGAGWNKPNGMSLTINGNIFLKLMPNKFKTKDLEPDFVLMKFVKVNDFPPVGEVTFFEEKRVSKEDYWKLIKGSGVDEKRNGNSEKA